MDLVASERPDELSKSSKYPYSPQFYDANIMFMLTQCVVHPISDSKSKSWTFATVAYALCWAISTLAVWLGWEVGYEYWRKWRSPEPAIEPIYFSLPATVHLALRSFHYFVFLSYIRLSPIGTPYPWDVIPETSYALIQLLPGLIPLLPRAAIAMVLLLSFGQHSHQSQTLPGATSGSEIRDEHFFRSDAPGQLTPYAQRVLYAFVIWVGARLVTTVASGVVLWLFSARPLGGLFTRHNTIQSLVTPRKLSFTPRDPSQTCSPQKSWTSAENEFSWAWKDRTRSRIQDAFELCMVRRNRKARQFGTMGQTTGTATGLAMDRRLFSPAGQPTAMHLSASTTSLTPFLHVPARPKSAVIPQPARTASLLLGQGLASLPNLSSPTQDAFYTPRETPAATQCFRDHSISEFGVRSRSRLSEVFHSDDPMDMVEELATTRTGEDVNPVESVESSPYPSIVPQHAASIPIHAVGTLSRARSTSVSLLRESVSNGLIKRARSGTLLSTDGEYSKVPDRDLVELTRELEPDCKLTS